MALPSEASICSMRPVICEASTLSWLATTSTRIALFSGALGLGAGAGAATAFKFMFNSAATKGMFVSVLRGSCATTAPVITFTTTGATVKVGGRTVQVTDADVTVQ